MAGPEPSYAGILHFFRKQRPEPLPRSDFIIPGVVTKPRAPPEQLLYSLEDAEVRAARKAAHSLQAQLRLLDGHMAAPGPKHMLSHLIDLIDQCVDSLQHPAHPTLQAPAWTMIAAPPTPERRSIKDLPGVWTAQLHRVLASLNAAPQTQALVDARRAATAAASVFNRELYSLADSAYHKYNDACEDAVLVEIQREMHAYGRSLRDPNEGGWKGDMFALYSPKFAKEVIEVAASAVAAGMGEAQFKPVDFAARQRRKARDVRVSVD